MSAPSANHSTLRVEGQDPYLRLHHVTIFVRDQDRSLRFYLDQLGFNLVVDYRFGERNRFVLVAPPDGTALLALVAPRPDSEEYKLIGQSGQGPVVFVTEDVTAKFHVWRERGVRFHHPPQTAIWGGMFTIFEDVDGNPFALAGSHEMTREIETQRRAITEKLESERRAAQELEIAKQVQARLFPQKLPPLRTLDYAGICIQARPVGGDYYDFLDLGRRRLGLVISDISGKGTAAALLMANLQAHVRNQSATYSGRPFTPFALEQPQRFLRTVNRLFCENTTANIYATLIFAEYDDTARRLRYANCGHLSAILLRSDNTLERLDSTCTVLGLFKDWDCSIGERQLFCGDTLLLYTDGVTESFNDAGEEFGEQRLIEALPRRSELPARALVAPVVDEIQQFSRHEQDDDITLIIAKCR